MAKKKASKATNKASPKKVAPAKIGQDIIDNHNVAQLARDAGQDYALVYTRIRRGWSLDKALKTPARKKSKSTSEKTAEAKALVKEVRNILENNTSRAKALADKQATEAYEQEVTDAADKIADSLRKPDLPPPVEKVEPPLLSEKAEQDKGFLIFLTLLGLATAAVILIDGMGWMELLR